jgi:hypothetical protein
MSTLLVHICKLEKMESWAQWPVVQTTQEAEIRRILVQGQPLQKS